MVDSCEHTKMRGVGVGSRAPTHVGPDRLGWPGALRGSWECADLLAIALDKV